MSEKLFDFRLEAQDGSGHFRQGRISANDRAEAKRVLEEREAAFAAFELPEERQAEIAEENGYESFDAIPKVPKMGSSDEERAEFRSLPVRDRAHVNLHRQAKPYKLVKLEEVK